MSLTDDLPGALRPRLRGWLHAWAFGAAVVAGLVLCGLAAEHGGGPALRSCAIYAASMAALFGVSALYHRRRWTPRGLAMMQRLDHAMIFVFIAGTYTPFCVALLPPATARLLLALVWGGALAGATLKAWWPRAPRWIGVPLYIALGWIGVLVVPELLVAGGGAGVALLVAGGVFYSVGAVFYALRWPNPWPRWFEHHECFHAATIVAAVCHHVAVYLAVLS